MSFHAGVFAKTFVTVLVIMDPVGSVPVFLGLVGEETPARQRQAAWQAAALAGGVVLAFALFGQALLRLLGIGLPALQVAGGLLLGLVALELFNPREEAAPRPERNVALVPLGTPLLAGPGAIVTAMFYIRSAGGVGGILSVVAALVAVILVTFGCLRFASVIGRLLGANGISVLTRLLGLLVTAIGVQLVAGGVLALTRR